VKHFFERKVKIYTFSQSVSKNLSRNIFRYKAQLIERSVTH